jgi:hypothetical protein
LSAVSSSMSLVIVFPSQQTSPPKKLSLKLSMEAVSHSITP